MTCGAPQSNHCPITLAAAAQEGLKCRFVIGERVPGSFSETASGNHFLFRLMASRRPRWLLAARYSLPNAAMVEAVQLLARAVAVLLDPVYTGKVIAGLIDQLRQGRWKAGQRVLFLHTGGAPALDAYESTLLGR